MKLKIFLNLIPALMPLLLCGGQTTFQIIFANGVYDEGQYVLETGDGGYLVTGVTEVSTLVFDVYLIKTDANGNIQWSKTLDYSISEGGYCIQKTSDKGYIITGRTQTLSQGMNSILLIKLDQLCNVMWHKIFPAAADRTEEGKSVQQTNDGGYIVAGSTIQVTSIDSDIKLIKTDPQGNLLWEKTFGGAYLDAGEEVLQTADGGFVVTGMISTSFGNMDVYLLKTDADGNEQWSRTFGGNANELARSVLIAGDGGYFIGATTNSFGAGSTDYYLIRTDKYGKELWSTAIGSASTEECFSVGRSVDGGLFLSGSSWGYGSGYADFYLVKTDSTGNLLWQSTFGGVSDDNAYSAQRTNDGGYIIAGRSFSYGNGTAVGYLVKTDSEGKCSAGIGVPDLQNINRREIYVYPNPFQHSAILKIPAITLNEKKNLIFSLYDVMGRQVQELYPDKSGKTVITKQGLTAGTYFYTLALDHVLIGGGKVAVE